MFRQAIAKQTNAQTQASWQPNNQMAESAGKR